MSDNTAFFSYSRVDSVFALKLAKDLRNAGIELWIDQLDIKPGSHWDASIENGLNASESMIVILSPQAVVSNNVMDEVSYGLECSKRIIPILLKECNTPFRLRRLQRIDFTGDYNIGFQQLLETLGSSPINKKNEIKEIEIADYADPVVETGNRSPVPPAPISHTTEKKSFDNDKKSKAASPDQEQQGARLKTLHKGRIISLIIAGVTLIFTFLPWWNRSVLLHTFMIGFNLRFGHITLAGILAVVIISLAGNRYKPFSPLLNVLMLGSFALIMIGAIWNMVSISSERSKINVGGYDYGVENSIGVGCWLTLLSGLIGLIFIVSKLIKPKTRLFGSTHK